MHLTTSFNYSFNHRAYVNLLLGRHVKFNEYFVPVL